MPGVIQQHYERLADAYDENWAYSPTYVRWMATQIIEALDLQPFDVTADIGCGTGLFSHEIASITRPRHPLQCVDPSAAMLSRLDTSAGLLPVHASAEDLAERRVCLPHAPLNAAWVKEAVHHLTDPATTLAGIAALLAPGGRLLIVMLPATIDYPLFDEALNRYEALQPDPAGIARHLSDAGLRTDLTHVQFQLTMSKERYLSMVRARYMSVLSTFTDAKIEAGVKEIQARHPEPELSYNDRFTFILGRRDDASPPSEHRAVTGGSL